MEAAVLADTRRARFNELLKSAFGGNIQALADKLDRAHAQVWQWLNGTRSISEKTAALIEERCSLPPGWMSGTPKLGGVVEEVVGALDKARADEIVDFLMFKVQQASTDTLSPEYFARYMAMLSRFKQDRGALDS